MSLSHWLVVLAIVLIVFGPKSLPNVGKSLGEGIRNFKKGLNGEDEVPHTGPTAQQPPQQHTPIEQRPQITASASSSMGLGATEAHHSSSSDQRPS